MEIRYLNKNDDPLAISDIYERSWKHAYKGTIPQAYLDAIPKGRWAKSLDREGTYHLVAVENGAAVGTASFCRSRWEKYKDLGEIVSIYFVPEYIGKGFGSLLLKKCEEELNRLGFSKLLLWVLEDNARARAFYEKNGFVFAGDYLQDNIGGKDLREVLYTKEF